MNGPEGEKYDKRKEIEPLEVASYDKPWWLRSILLTSRIKSHGTTLLGSHTLSVMGQHPCVGPGGEVTENSKT